jgi:NurA-like 5'-3' nuclease
MLIAQQKRSENIIEWVLYMWQIQDLIRANNFDIQNIDKNILGGIKDEEIKEKYTAWYNDLIANMKEQDVELRGNSNEINDVLMELLYLHNTLLNQLNDNKYRQIFDAAVPYLNEFSKKSNNSSLNQIELALQALYGKLLLKLSNQEISKETEEAFSSFSRLLAYVARQYHKMFNPN